MPDLPTSTAPATSATPPATPSAPSGTPQAATPTRPNYRTDSNAMREALKRAVTPPPKPSEETPREAATATSEAPAASAAPPKKETAPIRAKSGRFTKKDKSPERERDREVDYERIAKASARGVSEAMLSRAPQQASETVVDPNAALPEPVRLQLDVLHKMETMYPSKKGAAERYLTFWEKEQSYADQWETENPGKTFNANDTDHDDFYSNSPSFETDPEYLRAAARIEAEALAKENGDEIKNLKQELDRRDRLAQSQQITRQAMARTARQFVSLSDDPEIKPLFSPDGQFSQEALIKLQSDDPEKYGVVVNSLRNLDAVSSAAELLFSAVEPYNPKNQLHAAVGELASRAEDTLLAEIRAGRNEGRDGEGRKYIRLVDYNKLSPEERSDYWTTSAELVAAYAARQQAEQLMTFDRKRNEHFEALAKKRGYAKSEVSKGIPASKSSAAPSALPERAKPHSPSGAPDPVSGTTRASSDTKPKTALSLISQSFKARSSGSQTS